MMDSGGFEIQLPGTTPVEQMLRADLLRSAWMFAVVAMDAYFSDTYTDIVAANVISKSRHPATSWPECRGTSVAKIQLLIARAEGQSSPFLKESRS